MKTTSKLLAGLRSLRWKLFLSYICIGIIPMFILWWIVLNSLEDHLMEQRTQELRSHSTQTALMLNATNYMSGPVMRVIPNQHLALLSRSQQARIIVVDDMAMVIYDSFAAYEGNTLASSGVILALRGAHYSAIPERATIIEIAPVFDDENNVVGAVMMTHYVADLDILTDEIWSRAINFIFMLVAIVAVLVMIIAQWFMRPMQRILSATKKISEGQLEERVVLRNKDEFGDLGLAINDMTNKLAKVETARQEFVSSVSHELKTPLSSIKVLSESLLHQNDVANEVYKEFLGDITSEVDRMTDIVNELLSLVRLDEVELPLNVGLFSLNRMLKGVVRRLNPLAYQKDITIEFAEHRKVNIEADEMKLSLAITNLVENAIKYNKRGGHVKVILDADNKSALITVADTGVGISDENQTKVFARFFRVDKGRDRQTGGTGLGLAITHKTILLHKGSIKLTSKEEEGSTFAVRIPLYFR